MSIDLLQARIRKLKNPSMLGLDPTPELIPPHLREAAARVSDDPLQALSEAYLRFGAELLETLRPLVPAVKLSAPCFSALGYAGVRTMQELLRQAKALGYYVVLDAMQGEVPHIAALQAEACFGTEDSAPYPCDALTVNGYLGSDSIRPYLPYLEQPDGKNLFLLLKSSNKSGREVQDLISGDRLVHTAMADLAMRWSASLIGQNGYCQIGAIVGATQPQALQALRGRYNRLFLLVPGYGAQGGTGRQVQYAFDEFGHGAVISASRSIIGAWKNQPESDGSDYLAQALAAAEKMRNGILKYVTVL